MPKRGSKPKAPTDPPAAPVSPAPPPDFAQFPIVGIGASAGGIAPFLELLGIVGERPGMAFVYVLHQEKHNDGLAQVVSRATMMPVRRAADGMKVEPNHVYVAPSDELITMANGHLVTVARGDERGMPIDLFFRSLAEHHGTRAIGVVLSGSDSDGALGTKAIKAEGGITFAQDDSAKFALMPHAAVSTGSVDFVLPPDGIGAELLRIIRHPYVSARPASLPDGELSAIFRLLHAVHDVDFTHYKPGTVERRIRRRMALHKTNDVADYVTMLRENPRELERLCSDILIRVTGFFRDPEVFTALQREVFPLMLRDREDPRPLRIWVPGCATGEEVYSLAMALLEAVHDAGVSAPLQIFGTDVSEAAIQRARLGTYPESISAEVSAVRLQRFFVKEEGTYRVSKALRDCCIFARQDLTRDPPFSRLDLISCRNVMIYLGTVLQRKVMSIFHYALGPGGTLLLGSAESIGNHGEMFAIVDRRRKIYRKKASANRLTVAFESTTPRERVERVPMQEEVVPPANVFREADRVMLSRYSPPGVLIDENMDVLQFRGRTSLFLEPPSGVASFNVLKMAREGLLADLRAAIHAARKEETAVRREGVQVRNNGGTTLVDIEVIPFLSATKEKYQIVLFEEARAPEAEEKKGRKKEAEADTRHSARLKRELEATREYLQSIIEEQETMNEELRLASAEGQSTNEELQSTNEELETAKEELQSTNEELITLNDELENRNEELALVNNDLINLLASVDLPIVMLDSHLRIRRFNPGAQRTLNLNATDLGRSIDDLKATLEVDDLEQMVKDVIDNLEVREQEVKDRQGRRFALRIRPYKTVDNRIEGAVLVLIDRAK